MPHWLLRYYKLTTFALVAGNTINAANKKTFLKLATGKADAESIRNEILNKSDEPS